MNLTATLYGGPADGTVMEVDRQGDNPPQRITLHMAPPPEELAALDPDEPVMPRRVVYEYDPDAPGLFTYVFAHTEGGPTP